MYTITKDLIDRYKKVFDIKGKLSEQDKEALLNIVKADIETIEKITSCDKKKH